MVFFCLVSCCFLSAFEMRTILFLLLLFVSFCCRHLHFMFIAVSNHCEICRVFFHWCFMYPHWGFWNKLLDSSLRYQLWVWGTSHCNSLELSLRHQLWQHIGTEFEVPVMTTHWNWVWGISYDNTLELSLRHQLWQHIGTESVSYTHLTLPTSCCV